MNLELNQLCILSGAIEDLGFGKAHVNVELVSLDGTRLVLCRQVLFDLLEELLQTARGTVPFEAEFS